MSSSLIHSIFFSFFLFLVIVKCEDANKNYIAEISEDQLNAVRNQLRTESDEYQREFLRLILNPIDADINQDRKISPNELKKCLEKILLPKGEEAAMKIHPEVIREAKAGIELFVSNVRYSINYKQFSNLMTKVRTEHFIDLSRAKANSDAKIAEVELPDDL